MNDQHLKSLFTAIIVLGCIATRPAFAQTAYVGAGVGAPTYQDNVNGIAGNGSGLSGKVYGGYQLTPNVALEAGVANLGRIDNANGNVDGHGEYLDVVGLVPISEQWSLLGSVGITHVNLNTSAGDSSGNGMKLGVGAQYTLTNKVALRAEYEQYIPSTFGDRTNIGQYTVGVRVGF